jgi:UDP-N-acetylglucosamine 2-epimerase (non-hydrolysing)
MGNLSLTTVLGARPNFIKGAALLHEIVSRGLPSRLIHTGQHYSQEMSSVFFEELGITQPDISLEVASGSQIAQMALIMQRLEPLLAERPNDILVVVGDVTSTVAAALTASKLGIRVAHVEAGLRSFDRTMPEEINRIVTDSIADFLFTTEPSANENLRRENVSESRIFFTGNVMIDTLLRFRSKAAQSSVLAKFGLGPRGYAVVTLHRPSNVDNAEQLRELTGALRKLSERLPVIFPIHPRTQNRMRECGIPADGLTITGPLGYLDFLALMAEARMVLTDSGGIQEETTILRVPCLTLRENTERPITLTHGTNRLVGTSADALLKAANDVLRGPVRYDRMPELWDGAAAKRIIDVLERAG